jgi:hypothetical protein
MRKSRLLAQSYTKSLLFDNCLARDLWLEQTHKTYADKHLSELVYGEVLVD